MNPDVSGSRPLHRWKGRDLAFFGGAFLFLFVAAVFVRSLILALIGGPMVEVVTALGLTFAVEAALLSAACVLVQRVYGLSFYEEMRISLDYKIGSPSLVVLGMALALSVVLVSAMVARFVPGLVPEQETPIEQLLTTPGSVVLFAIFGIAIAPALEELMFRGFLFRVLQDVVGMSIAVWTTAAIFALFHGPQLWPNWPAIIVILGVGYVLSKLRERTDSVIPGFIVHTVYNAVLFLLFAFASVTGANDLR